MTTCEWFYLLHLLSEPPPPAVPWVSTDEGSAVHGTPALPSCLSSTSSRYYPQMKKEAGGYSQTCSVFILHL